MGADAPRPATAFQLHRLNLLGLLRLSGEDTDGVISFAAADVLLAETARQGLWTPARGASTSPA